MSSRTVWGHVIETDPHGRCRWPDELKYEVVRRVVAGQRISSIGQELGTSPELVRKWWLKLKPEDYGLPLVDEPFTELHVVDDEVSAAGGAVVSSSRFTINGITIEAQRDIAIEDLTLLLQAMGRVR